MDIERTSQTETTYSVPALDEVLEFLLSQPTPQQIIDFHTSEPVQERIRFLLDANKNRRLTDAEQGEMDEISIIVHFMRMLKARARRKLKAANDVHP